MLSPYLESLIRLLYPAACATCKKPLNLNEECLCSSCSQDLQKLAWPTEQTLFDEPLEHLTHVWSAFAYQSPLKELLHSVKYHHKDYLLKTIRSPSETLGQLITSDSVYDALIPIPIDRKKYIERHFNQAEVLASFLAPQVTPPVWKNVIQKRWAIPSQASLNRAEREINVYGAFKVKKPGLVRGRAFLLIDDVLTTGATANEAARILKEAGAKRVDLLTLARTVHGTEALSTAP